MGKFRKKPIEVEAHQWFKNGDHPDDDCRFTGERADGTPLLNEGKVVRYYRDPDDNGDRLCERCRAKMHDHGWIDTPECGHVVCPGDWIITGVVGERYPRKDEIFKATYDPVGEDPVARPLTEGRTKGNMCNPPTTPRPSVRPVGHGLVEALPDGFITPFEQESELWDELRALIGKGELFDAVKRLIDHRIEILQV